MACAPTTGIFKRALVYSAVYGCICDNTVCCTRTRCFFVFFCYFLFDFRVLFV